MREEKLRSAAADQRELVRQEKERQEKLRQFQANLAAGAQRERGFEL